MLEMAAERGTRVAPLEKRRRCEEAVIACQGCRSAIFPSPVTAENKLTWKDAHLRMSVLEKNARLLSQTENPWQTGRLGGREKIERETGVRPSDRRAAFMASTSTGQAFVGTEEEDESDAEHVKVSRWIRNGKETITTLD
jgi:hypothetical protein